MFGNKDPIEIIMSNEFIQKFPEYEEDLENSLSSAKNKELEQNKSKINY